MLSLCFLASTCKNLTFCICKTLKRAANSYGVCGPDVPKNNNQYHVVSIILLITMVWGQGDRLGRAGRRTNTLHQATPAFKVPSRSSDCFLTVFCWQQGWNWGKLTHTNAHSLPNLVGIPVEIIAALTPAPSPLWLLVHSKKKESSL